MNSELEDRTQEYTPADRNTANNGGTEVNDAVGTYTAQVELDTCTELSEAMIEKIDSLYQYAEREEVLDFLTLHPDIAGILPDAHQVIRGYFPAQECQLRYSPYMDSLYVYILSEDTVENTRSRFNELDAAWYQPLAQYLKDFLNINVTYV